MKNKKTDVHFSFCRFNSNGSAVGNAFCNKCIFVTFSVVHYIGNYLNIWNNW